jgi:pyruvate formate lyase activating enzyme
MLQIGGLTPLTTIDYPDHLVAVIFCQGCSWNCYYCHNQHLLDRHNTNYLISWSELLVFLKTRKNFLDAVVFSGGEPLLQKNLPKAMQIIKNMGFKIALHTAGSTPSRLQKILPIVDWIGFDIKAFSFSKYSTITQIVNSGNKAQQSLELLLNSQVEYEIRTTVEQNNLNYSDLLVFANKLSQQGVKNFTLQSIRNTTHATTIKLPSFVTEQLTDLFSTFNLR